MYQNREKTYFGYMCQISHCQFDLEVHHLHSLSLLEEAHAKGSTVITTTTIAPQLQTKLGTGLATSNMSKSTLA